MNTLGIGIDIIENKRVKKANTQLSQKAAEHREKLLQKKHKQEEIMML